MDEPTTHELGRRVTSVEDRADTQARELRSEMQAGFADIRADIAKLVFVSPDLFTEAQRRQDAEIEAVRSEVIWLRRQILYGIMTALLVGVAVSVGSGILEGGLVIGQ